MVSNLTEECDFWIEDVRKPWKNTWNIQSSLKDDKSEAWGFYMARLPPWEPYLLAHFWWGFRPIGPPLIHSMLRPRLPDPDSQPFHYSISKENYETTIEFILRFIIVEQSINCVVY